MAELDDLGALIARELPSLIALRRDIHAHPEVGLEERRTAALIQRELEASNVACCAHVAGGTGVIAHIPGDAAQAVALRADIDALPIDEATSLSYASKTPGVMHACGHDGHTAILIGAARVLARIAEQRPLPRPVTFLFQPAEEGLGGASRMIADGALTGRIGSPVSEIFGLHAWPWLPLHTVGVRDGAILASADAFTVHVNGRGAHAAWPHLSRDPVVAMCAIVSAAQTIVSRTVDPTHAAVVSFCAMHVGDAPNVIAESGIMRGTLRALNSSNRAHLIAQLRHVASHAAQLHHCEASVEFSPGCPATLNDRRATERVRDAVRAVVGSKLVEMPTPFMGGEDFSAYGEHIPASFFLLGIQNEGAPALPPLHHPTFDFNDDAIAGGVETMCRLALH